MKKIAMLILLSFSVKAQEYVREEPKKTDWVKVACLTDFGITYGEFLTLPYSLRSDYLKHYIAGQLIGMGSDVFYYRLTHKKWLSNFLAIATTGVIGGAKEMIDPYRGGSRTWQDAAWTFGGGLRGAFRMTWYLDKHRKEKKNFKQITE